MSKTAINNEIVLMRQAVRKSRVSVIRKLIKEAKLLNARKHGDEKIVEKCKRKAKRLVAEIEASKKIKDDDITKYGITETKCLQEILSDKGTEPSTRIMARLAHHKFLRDRILKFKETFPSYEEFLGPGRKKMSKLQRKANREARNRIECNGETINRSDSKVQLEKVNENVSEEDTDDTKDSKSEDESSDSEACEKIEENKMNDEPPQDSSTKEEPEPESILSVTTSKKKKNAQSEESARPKRREIKVPTNSPAKAKKQVPVKVISEEATVKRFSDLTEKNEPSEIVERINGKKLRKGLTIEKQADAFFMTENGESEYMSVVVPKLEPCGEDDQGDQYHRNHGTKRQRTFHEKNDKFFNKIDQPKHDYAKKFGRNDDRTMERFARSGKANVDKFRNVKGGFEKKNDVKEEELHPSWQARKKQQEILKQGFQGKKIVFDD